MTCHTVLDFNMCLQLKFPPPPLAASCGRNQMTEQKFLQAVGQMRRKCCKVAKKGTLNISKLDRAANVVPKIWDDP